MQNAQKRNACLSQKFWFRKDITTQVSPPEANECCKKCEPNDCDIYTLMTVNEIINGKVRIAYKELLINFDFFHNKSDFRKVISLV